MLHIHRAERADALADALCTLLLEPLEDPFAAEVVAVPTRGMERWLTQRMSARLGASSDRRDGVCANIDFPFPGRLVAVALATATGIDPDSDPWVAERLVWPLLQVVDESITEPWLHGLATHLGNAADTPTRRFASVRQIADLYDRYAVRRPQMLCAWAIGEDADGSGRQLPHDGVWQAELWRRVRARIGRPSPAERLDDACRRIRASPELIELPRRLALFGLTRLPSSYLQLFDALAGGERDVHLFVLHPSPALWERIGAEATPAVPGIRSRTDDPTSTLPDNRLLASWGQDSRELQLVLAAGDAPRQDHHHELPSGPATLLSLIQDGIRADRAPAGSPLTGEPDARPELDPADRSIQVHSCHGRARQVEVIRDTILHLLEDDPTLEPRDVIVMCPEIETVAPLIQASFGAGRVDAQEPDGEDGLQERRLPDLRVRLADRSLRQTNPILSAISQLLELADQRATASQLLDLADREPVRRRFRLDDDDVGRMQEWVVASGIRWGLDAEHRAPFKLEVIEAGTWQAGLDRILLGVAMTEDDRRLMGGVLPLEDVDSNVIDLAGRMAEFLDRVRAAFDALNRVQPVDAWADAIAGAADALTATTERDSWQRAELQRILDGTLADAAHVPAGANAPELELADVRALLADHLRGRPTRANFRTGHLTVCTLVPMRSVPHRVVCVLGLDDGEFPRKAPRDGDDLMLRDVRVGDRDPRSEDRQMLLDALLAATERLIITYTGNDERTNLLRPPAVPVAELLDVIERTVRGGAPDPRGQVQTRHPLQPFDPRNFERAALIPGGPWSFDQVALGGARALAAAQPTPERFLGKPLPPLATPLIELEDLVRFVEHPVRAFLRIRLGVSVREFPDEVQDALPVELDGLGDWGVGQRLLEGMLAGASLDDCVQAELARGTLPPAMLALPVLDRVRPIAEALAHEAARHGGGAESASLDVNLALPGGRLLAGTVPGVYGDTIRRASYSRVRPKDRLAAWVRLLALTAARPERPFESVVIGRAGSRSSGQVALARIHPLGRDARTREATALAHLAVLVDLYERGMREPLPLACQTSAAYAQAAVNDDDAPAAAQRQWETEFRFDKEDREPEHLLVHGGALSTAELLAEPPRDDEQRDGWPESEASRFGRYSRRLWDGLLAVEVVGEQ